MKISGILKILKKGSKAAARRGKAKKGAETIQWPSGLRIGVFGHANAGKTVYFTVLNEECKIAKDLQISVTDTATAAEFLSHYRMIWGLSTATGTGTIVDSRGEKKFPESTSDDRLLLFNAILDKTKKVSVVAYDYNGRAVDISGADQLADKVDDFMCGCDGILFFYDPKVLGAELESQARVASFVHMLERLAPLKSRLPIPLALVVTKADVLPGFSSDEQVALMRSGEEYLSSEEYEFFLEKVLSGEKVAGNANWAGSVRNVLVRLKDFLYVVLRRTLDFQIFFISSTGQEPTKVGTEVGRSIYTPPAKMQPVGVRAPFYWLLKSIIRNRRISRFRTLAKYAAVFSVIWIVLYSLPFVYHFKWLYTLPADRERNVMAAYHGDILSVTEDDRNKIASAYRKYERTWLVRWVFDEFQVPADRIAEMYQSINVQDAVKNLDTHIGILASIVADSVRWPKVNPSDSALVFSDQHKTLIAAISGYHKEGDENSPLYKRSARVLVYWDLFTKGVRAPKDTLVWKTIQDQVQTDKSMYVAEMSAAEGQLCNALLKHKIQQVQAVVAQQAGLALDSVLAGINDNLSPEFRLKTVVDQLQALKPQLNPADQKRVTDYLSKVDKWRRSQTFRYKIESIPEGGHVHIAVAEKGADPVWQETQMFQNYEYEIVWKMGDAVYISFDMPNSKEEQTKWGRSSDGKSVFRDDYALFKMDGSVPIETAGKTVNIRFIPSLVDQLPVLK
jgi:hypothetical protein